jgi:hypothetical protein
MHPTNLIKLLHLTVSLAVVALVTAAPGTSSAQNPLDEPYAVDYYYKVQWGHAEEFIELYKKNHYPILERQVETGRFLSVSAVEPRFHATEEGRWDYRVTIVFRDVAAAHDPGNEADIILELYPDQETFRREEQRRFQILDAHWDVPLTEVPLDD